MSDEAIQDYEEALKEQHSRNEARRIRTRVTEARRNPHSAGLRWPFELLQNALDAGPRDGTTIVSIRLRREPATVLFEHDGAPFTSLELAALLSGGSSKEFESEVTTGRFGTGFLVTHVLAERTGLSGLLKVPSGFERFQLHLHRGGDEDAILANIHSCKDAIRNATVISDLDGHPSAQFEYPITDGSTLELGYHALKRALPYLFATCARFGRIVFETEGNSTEVWEAKEVSQYSVEGGLLESHTINVCQEGLKERELRVFRFMSDRNAAAGALVLVERTDNGWRVQLPEVEAPRVYRQYPLRASGFVPISFVLDGQFEADQERSCLLMSDRDRELLQAALCAAIVAVRFALDQKWEGAHLLARARRPSTCFYPTNEDEQQWWTSQLAEFARQLAGLPIVQCRAQHLPAIAPNGSVADFVVPRLVAESTHDETTVERLWPLVDAAVDLMPPINEIAAAWTDTAEGWHSLGLDVNRVSVRELTRYVRDGAAVLEDLRVEGSRIDWLASCLDIVGECWSKRKGVDLSVLSGILPNQNQRLCSPDELHRDGGVSERLKAICAEIGHDVREDLLLQGIGQAGKPSSLNHLTEAIERAVGKVLSESTVVHDAIEQLTDELPEDEECGEDSRSLQEASVKLMEYLWDSQGRDAAPSVQKMPLITSTRRSVRWSHDRMMMAPVRTWPETAQPFSQAYPPQRVLDEVYARSGAEVPSGVVNALVAWEIAIDHPITVATPAELKERRLASICACDSEGLVVKGETFSQIALLQPEVLNRCQEGIEEARALLGLVLCHVAPFDPAWQTRRIVKGRRSGHDVDVPVHGALWLADLKVRAWVPFPDEDGKPQKMVANKATLEHLLDSVWLERNDAGIRLLSDWFEFDELELRLLGLSPDQVQRKELRNGLAKLVESGGADPELYASLTQEVERRQRQSRDVDRCRRLGLAVQDAVKVAMENYGLMLELVDRGFDYEVALGSDGAVEDFASRFDIGPYLLEVKATTTGQPRLTPMQASTASAESSRYALCVVDLRDLSDEDLDAEWTAARVEPLAKIVSDIGGKVAKTWLLVEAATTSSVAICNEGVLRYGVPAAVWSSGVSITDWVASISR